MEKNKLQNRTRVDSISVGDSFLCECGNASIGIQIKQEHVL